MPKCFLKWIGFKTPIYPGRLVWETFSVVTAVLLALLLWPDCRRPKSEKVKALWSQVDFRVQLIMSIRIYFLKLEQNIYTIQNYFITQFSIVNKYWI